MRITERNFSGNADLEAMAELVRKFPAENLHVVDLPYRLSSWSFDFPENIRLWMDENGQLLAWAVLQVPFWTMDYAYHPEFENLHPHILKWTDAQAQKIINTPSGHPAWFVTALASQTERIRDLEQAGFASQADVGEDSWTQVLMEYTFPTHEELSLPEGFVIRPLNGLREVPAYVDLHQAVFESKNMTIEWRQRTLLSERSENGNGKTTTSPAEGTTRLHPPQVSSNLRRARLHLAMPFQRQSTRVHRELQPVRGARPEVE